MTDEEGQRAEAPTLNARCRVCERPIGATAVFCGGCGVRLRSDGINFVEEDVTAADPLIGRVIADRYEIMSLLGRGGMGVVYQVEHVHIGKVMAMKLLHGELARNRNTLKRFQREAEAVSRLNHPNTVQLFDYGRDGDLVYLVMEHLDGPDLGAMIKRTGGLDFRSVAGLMEQVAASVAEAHAHGIIHRDLKPENIMVLDAETPKPRAKVLDFGLAKLREGEGASHVSITRAGAVVGTPYYMSPEQIRGADIDGRSDIYALGAVMFRALTGVPPFRAASPMAVLSKHLNEPLQAPSQLVTGGIPPEADDIVIKALAKDPSKRYQSMGELREALLDFLVARGDRVADASSGRRSLMALASSKNSAQVIRSELERYERRLRRRGLVIYLLVALVVGAMAAGVAVLWDESLTTQLSSGEVEPNNSPAEATPIEEGLVRSGFLGRRQSTSAGDLDLYRIENAETRTRPIRVRVTGVPNMDIVLAVYRGGFRTAVLSSNGQSEGGGEEIIGFPLSAAPYFLGVRDRWIENELPTENVSDPYRIQWEFMAPDEHREREYNDALEQSENIELGIHRTGHIGWEGDQDVFCVLGAADNVRVYLSGVERLNLRLKVVDRQRRTSQTIDRGGVGEPEVSPVFARATSGDTCFEVSAVPAALGLRTSGESYRLELRPISVDGGQEPSAEGEAGEG